MAGRKQSLLDKIPKTFEEGNLSNFRSRKDDNYYKIYGWMTNRLKLAGNELHVYGLIFSFTKDGTSEFHGSAEYIATALNMTRRTVVKILKVLTSKRLIKKRVIGRYCNYSIAPVNNFHTSCEEFAQETVNCFHTSCEDSSHHIKSISKVDIKSGSSEITTTTVEIFVNKCKEAGYSLDKKTAGEILDNGLDPAWLESPYSFPEYIAEVIQEKYQDKTQEEKRRLFRKILAVEDRKDDFPEWREKKAAESAAQEKHSRQEAAADAERKRIEQAKTDKPKICKHCMAAIAVDGERGICRLCGWDYLFNKENGEWEFSSPRSLVVELKKLSRHERSEADDTS